MAQESLHFGATLPQIKRTWEEVRETAIAFDDCGFDSVWVCDHIYGVPLPTLPMAGEYRLWPGRIVGPTTGEVGALVHQARSAEGYTGRLLRSPQIAL